MKFTHLKMPFILLAGAFLFIGLQAGCSGEKHPAESIDADADGDTDSDADGDTDADSDSGADISPSDAWGISFSPPSGTFEGSVEVSLSTDENQAGEIRYTTDGSAPTEESATYIEPIQVESTTVIHAAVFENGTMVAEGSGVYIPRDSDISNDLPILIIDNIGAGELSETDRTYVDSVFMTFDTTSGSASLSGSPDVASAAGIHIRGQSSATFEKHPYRVELRDRDGQDQDWPVLGMPAEADWVLRGPFVDKALIRDAFHYDLSRDIGMEAPRYRFCELYTNFDGDAVEAADYQGVYMLVETIKNAKNRLDLKQLKADDVDPTQLSGGYIFKFEWQAAEEPILACPGTSDCWHEMEIVDPIDMNLQQSDWLASYLYEFSEALHSSTLNDAANGYGHFIDVTSFADQIIMNEIGREADAYIRSAFFYKDRDDVLYAGPLWDYNLSLGTGFDLMGLENLATSGWMYDVNNTRNNPSNDWFIRMVQDPEFASLLAQRWQELRTGLLSDTELNARIDALSAPLANGAARNFERWNNLNLAAIGFFQSPTSNSWEDQVEILRDWLMERTAWLDSQWN